MEYTVKVTNGMKKGTKIAQARDAATGRLLASVIGRNEDEARAALSAKVNQQAASR